MSKLSREQANVIFSMIEEIVETQVENATSDNDFSIFNKKYRESAVDDFYRELCGEKAND